MKGKTWFNIIWLVVEIAFIGAAGASFLMGYNASALIYALFAVVLAIIIATMIISHEITELRNLILNIDNLRCFRETVKECQQKKQTNF